MVDRLERQRWYDGAQDARRAAVVQADSGHHNWACFLAEQSAQLSLKAFLHGIGTGAWGHDPVALGASIESHLDTRLDSGVRAALQRLSRHYIPARYPDAHAAGSPAEHYGPNDSRQALADLDEIMALLDRRWRQAESGSEA